MAIFKYRGFDNDGKSVSGVMAADNEAGLEEKLRAAGCWLLRAEQDAGVTREKIDAEGRRQMASWGRVKRRDLIEFATILGFQTREGVPLIPALETATHHCENPRFRGVLHGLRRHLEAGLFFYEALGHYPKIFPPNFVSMVRAGENSGKLPEVFIDLRNYLEWLDGIVSDIRQASLYPAIVLTVVSGFVLFLFSFIIPQFAELLTSVNVELPLMTQIIFGISGFAKATWWIWLTGLLVGGITVHVLRRVSESFALAFDRMKLKLPVFGELNHMLSISRFTHNLSILYRSGIVILQSLELCKGLVGNVAVERAVGEVRDAVKAGEGISEAMARHDVFPPLLLRMVVLGEKTGHIDTALENVSTYYNEVIPRRIKRIFTIMEPAIMLCLIGVVGVVAMSIFLPILSLMDAAK
ncbi:MAG TPA: type II secretion system F family protein [Methylomirabilota bacterium]|nr:type II secretion system F family protein [Methylomirabilota bacterium]